jgi:hypothetical protein
LLQGALEKPAEVPAFKPPPKKPAGAANRK